MKNKKLIIVFTLIAMFLLVMVTYAKASDVDDLPTIVTDPNGTTNNSLNNENANTPANNTNTSNTDSIGVITNTSNNNANIGNNNTLPQTGVQEDTMLFVFIGICIASAIYAFVRIRKYKNIH